MTESNPHLITFGHLVADPQWRLSKHSDMFDALVVPLRGKLRVTIHNRSYSAQRGDLLYYPKHTPHTEHTDPADPLESYFLYFKWDHGDKELPILVNDVESRILLMVSWLYEGRNQHGIYSEHVCDSFLDVILAEAFKSLQIKQDRLVAVIRAHIGEHLAEPLTLEGLAAQVGMSMSYFDRRYKALTGRTPMQELQRLRLDAACKLLLTTRLPLKAIAVEVGISDEYYLSRLFRKTFNVTPAEFRRQL